MRRNLCVFLSYLIDIKQNIKLMKLLYLVKSFLIITNRKSLICLYVNSQAKKCFEITFRIQTHFTTEAMRIIRARGNFINL